MTDPAIVPNPTNVLLYKILILAVIGLAFLDRKKIKKWLNKKVNW